MEKEESIEVDRDATEYRTVEIRLRGTFFQQMNMFEFPFDVQVR